MMLLWPLIALGRVFRVVTTLTARHRAGTSACGRWRLFLAALAALVVSLLGVTSASAATVPAAGTRVGASTPATQVIVGVHECITAGQRWAKAPPQAGSASANGVAAKGADEAFSAGKYLNDTWYKSTFPNRTQSVQYHLAKHGKGRTAVEYTQDAMDFFAQNRSLGQSVILRDGTAGIKISTKQPLPGGGTQRVGGYWTNDGRLVTYWD